MLNFVLCDDNLNIVKKLKEMLEIIFVKNDIEATVSFFTDNPNEVLEYEEKHNVDVLILDINLNSNMSGIDLAQKIRKRNKKIYLIFSTGHLEYSLLAYSVKIFDYLPKPLTLERLEITLNRLIDDLNNEPSKKFVKINTKTFLNEKDINYIKRDGMKLIFYTNENQYETYTSLNRIESLLSSNFVRCHKSYIANTENIVDINIRKNIIVFNNNITCDIGPKYRQKLSEVLNYESNWNNLDIINNRKYIIN